MSLCLSLSLSVNRHRPGVHLFRFTGPLHHLFQISAPLAAWRAGERCHDVSTADRISVLIHRASESTPHCPQSVTRRAVLEAIFSRRMFSGSGEHWGFELEIPLGANLLSCHRHAHALLEPFLRAFFVLLFLLGRVLFIDHNSHSASRRIQELIGHLRPFISISYYSIGLLLEQVTHLVSSN